MFLIGAGKPGTGPRVGGVGRESGRRLCCNEGQGPNRMVLLTIMVQSNWTAHLPSLDPELASAEIFK